MHPTPFQQRLRDLMTFNDCLDKLMRCVPAVQKALEHPTDPLLADVTVLSQTILKQHGELLASIRQSDDATQMEVEV